jgi:hypothetical protein
LLGLCHPEVEGDVETQHEQVANASHIAWQTRKVGCEAIRPGQPKFDRSKCLDSALVNLARNV